MYKKIWDSWLFNVVKREVRRMTNSWVYLFMTLLGPLFSFIIVMNIFVEGTPNNLPITVIDYDNSALSRNIINMVNATKSVNIISNSFDLNQARNEMLKGNIDAILVVPQGFEKEVLRAQNKTLELYINNTNVLKGSLIQSDIYKAINTASTGVKIQVAMKGGAKEEAAYAQSYPVQLDQHILFNPYTNYSYFLATSLFPVLLIVFILLGSIYAIGIEIREGTTKLWLEAANNKINVAVIGKLLPYLFLMIVNTGISNYILSEHRGFQIKGNWLIMMLGQIFMLVAYQATAIIMLCFSGNTRLSLSLGSAYSMMAITFSGLTFPVFAMPKLAQVFAHIFPFYYWMQIFMSQGLRNAPIFQTIIPLLMLLLFIVVGWMLLPRLEKIILDSEFQNKL